ncbi:MAG TPA: 4Fe-4S ferredoxin [Syntrophus sp. (in: bacteria)]|jgi:Pyruvate/2-oxoacid:ferredoxin oxidoreductase delta subunit|nr:4Fe-4S ferredoxin [Syntrophus sp. (in: bacteria)]
MNSADLYQELTQKVGMAHSAIVPDLWRMICTEEEARIVNAMPGTAESLAETFGKPVAEMQALLDELYHRGVAFDYVKDGRQFYRMPRHIIQFHDATILWPEAPQALLDLWVKFTEEEYPSLPALVTQAGLPSFFRVIPVNEAIASKSEVLPYEDAAKILENANSLAVTKCTCRFVMKKCDRLLEACIQLNRGADYAIKRGTGRRIDVAEGKEILKQARAAGLVHMTENKAGIGNVICNCCDCCCIGIPFAKNPATRGVIATSRYRADVDAGSCTACGLCIEVCPVEAISENGADAVTVDPALCIGCGLCAFECPVAAIGLKQVHPASFIPA